MPSDLQYKDKLRKEEIKLENLLKLLKSQKYQELEETLEHDLKHVRDSLQD